jgi:ribose-phosphate pyrophosphokinase
MIVTDTIKLDPEKANNTTKIKVLSTADLFGKAIKSVNQHFSIEELFQVD